mmetsp:Transcript_16630/g.29115  ORF Transcript_16630/g.29115 Transcript_16630/m.29115 type:complete len:264 (+) Transcript_16630:196-987(+)
MLLKINVIHLMQPPLLTGTPCGTLPNSICDASQGALALAPRIEQLWTMAPNVSIFPSMTLEVRCWAFRSSTFSSETSLRESSTGRSGIFMAIGKPVFTVCCSVLQGGTPSRSSRTATAPRLARALDKALTAKFSCMVKLLSARYPLHTSHGRSHLAVTRWIAWMRASILRMPSNGLSCLKSADRCNATFSRVALLFKLTLALQTFVRGRQLTQAVLFWQVVFMRYNTALTCAEAWKQLCSSSSRRARREMRNSHMPRGQGAVL